MRNRICWENVREFCETQTVARCEAELVCFGALALRYCGIHKNLKSYILGRKETNALPPETKEKREREGQNRVVDNRDSSGPAGRVRNLVQDIPNAGPGPEARTTVP